MNSKLLRFMNVVAALATIIFNALSQALPIGVSTNADIANRLPIYFFPANITFSIWGLIYIGWLAFALYQALDRQADNPFVRAVGWWFVLGSLGNVGWLVLFQHLYFLPSQLPIVWLLLTLGIIYVRLRQVRAPRSTWDTWAIFVPFSIYFAWAAVANVANVTYILYDAGVRDLLGIAEPTWGAIMLVVGGAITGAVAYFNRDIAYVAVIVWAFVGIILRYPEVQVVALTAGAVATVAALVVLGVTLLNRQGGRAMPGAA